MLGSTNEALESEQNDNAQLRKRLRDLEAERLEWEADRKKLRELKQFMPRGKYV